MHVYAIAKLAVLTCITDPIFLAELFVGPATLIFDYILRPIRVKIHSSIGGHHNKFLNLCS